jgi:hypothetical protein
MVRAFGRVIATRAAVLYARTPALTSPFERLPADVWSLLEIADWQNGVAVAPGGTRYWSIHAADAGEPATRVGGIQDLGEPGRGGPIDRGIREAIGALWPSGIPGSLRAKHRDNQIRQYLVEHGHSIPEGEGLAKAVQRALKPRP